MYYYLPKRRYPPTRLHGVTAQMTTNLATKVCLLFCASLQTTALLKLNCRCILFGGTRWRSWLRHCATSRKVAGSIPDCVIGIFHWHNPSGRTMDLGSTQPLTEMSTRNISWGLRRPVRTADNLTTFMCRLSWNLGASTSWNPQGLSGTVMGLLLVGNSLGKNYHPGGTTVVFRIWQRVVLYMVSIQRNILPPFSGYKIKIH